MGFNWQGAAAGLLTEVGDQGEAYAKRQYELKQRQHEQAIADRKEAAALAKQEAMLRLQYDKMASQERIAAEQRAADSAKQDANTKLQYDKMDSLEKQNERRHQEILAKGKGDKETSFESKLKAIENDPDLTPEKKKEAKMALYGVKNKGELSEDQAVKLEMQLAEIVVTDDIAMKQSNAIRKMLNMPLLKKVEKTPGKDGGLFGIGAKDPEYDYVEDYDEKPDKGSSKTGNEDQGKTDEDQPKKTGGLSLADAKAILTSGKGKAPLKDTLESQASNQTGKPEEVKNTRADELKRQRAEMKGGILSSAGIDEVVSGGKELLSGAIQGAKTAIDVYSALIGKPFVDGAKAVITAQQKAAAIGTLEAKFKQGVITEDEFNKAYELLNK